MWGERLTCYTQKFRFEPRLPLSGSIDLTYRCNNDCLHCWLVTPSSPETRHSELTTAEWKGIIDQAREMGAREWTISGGEPLLRADFVELLEYVKEKARWVSVATNGTLIDAGLARALKGCDVQISLYGATAEVFDHCTRHPGSFNKTLAGIDCLRQHDVPFTIRVFAMKDNFHQYQQMLELARQWTDSVRLGAAWLHLSAAGDAGKNREIQAQRLSPQQVIELDPPNLCWHERNGTEDGCWNAETRKGLYSACFASRSSFHIDPYGLMSFCQCIKDPALRFDLRSHSFAEIWDKELPDAVQAAAGGDEYRDGCASCDRRRDCRWCSAFSYLEYREQGRPIPYLCDIAAEKIKYEEHWRRHHRRFFEIAGFSIQVDSSRPFIENEFDHRFDPFRCESAGPKPIRLEHYYGLPNIDCDALGAPIFDQAPWRVFRNEKGLIYICYVGEPSEKRWLHVSSFTMDHSLGQIFNNPEYFPPGTTYGSLAHFVTDQIWIAQLLSYHQGFYLHSTGMIRRGQGMLFVGPSEAGKSTMTRMLAAQVTVLCDDRNIVRRLNNEWRVYGTWSHGEIPVVSNHHAPLRAVFFLEKSTENRIQLITNLAERKNRLLPRVIRPVMTPEWWDRTLPLLGQLAEQVPCYIMHFDKSGGIVPHIERLMDGLKIEDGFTPENVKTGIEQGVVVGAEF